MALLKDLLTENIGENERWLIEYLVPLGEITALYAPKDHHKTSVALKMAMEVITGGKELGASKTGKVMYYALDNPNRTEMINRVLALMETSYPDHLEEIGLNLNISWPRLNLTTHIYQEETDDDGNIDIYESKYWHDLGQKLVIGGYRFLIIDTLSKSIVGAGVNDDAVIRKVIEHLRRVISGAVDRISILIVHHTGKDARKGMMGSSILKNDLSTVLKIKKNKDGFELVREAHKSEYSGKSIPFKGRTVVLEKNDKSYKSVYIDIGTGLDEFDAQIVEQFNKGLSKKEINGNTRLLGLGNNTTDKSFAVSFNRRWNRLIDSGFIQNKKQDNKT